MSALAQPVHRAVEATPGFFAVSQAVVGHGQEEQVEGIELTVARPRGSFRGLHRLGETARPVEDDAQRVEGDRLVPAPVPRPGAQPQRRVEIRVATGPVASSQARLLQHSARRSRTGDRDGSGWSAASSSAIAGPAS